MGWARISAPHIPIRNEEVEVAATPVSRRNTGFPRTRGGRGCESGSAAGDPRRLCPLRAAGFRFVLLCRRRSGPLLGGWRLHHSRVSAPFRGALLRGEGSAPQATVSDLPAVVASPFPEDSREARKVAVDPRPAPVRPSGSPASPPSFSRWPPPAFQPSDPPFFHLLFGARRKLRWRPTTT